MKTSFVLNTLFFCFVYGRFWHDGSYRGLRTKEISLIKERSRKHILRKSGYLQILDNLCVLIWKKWLLSGHFRISKRRGNATAQQEGTEWFRGGLGVPTEPHSKAKHILPLRRAGSGLEYIALQLEAPGSEKHICFSSLIPRASTVNGTDTFTEWMNS